MKTRTALLIAVVSLTFALAACSGNDNSDNTANTQTEQTQQEEASATENESDQNSVAEADTQASDQASTEEGGIEVDKGLLNVDINISAESAEFYGMKFKSQEDADAYAKEQGFKSVKLNDDGSITITMSKAKHKEFMEGFNKSLDEGLQEMIGSEDYPNFVSIEHNDTYSEFKVTTKSESLDFNESFSTLGFYMYGILYNSFNGTPIDNVHVDYINEASGEVIDTFDSKNLEDAASEETTDDTDYSAQLETEEYSYEDYDSTMHFIVVRNNSDQTLTVSTNTVAYNESGDKIGAGTGHLEAIGPGKEQVVIEFLDSVTGVDHFDDSLTASKAQWYIDATENIEDEADILEDKVIITCTNNGKAPAQSVEGRVLFFKDGECIGYDTQYFVDEEGELKPGDSLTKQFNFYDGSFDEAKYYICGTVNK